MTKAKNLLTVVAATCIASSFLVNINPSYAFRVNPDGGQGNIPGDSQNNGCIPSGGQPKKCDTDPTKVPEPASTAALLLMGAGIFTVGLKRKFQSRLAEKIKSN